MAKRMVMRNTLGSESSPYLLQHAQNPVYWQSWENTDFESLKKQNKLLLISIGYATCHWCHVMERECFESEEVAQLMNTHFHAIKVDREERPDLDQIYMQALQLLTGHGGWPLNIVALPDGRPLWGATYLPKDQWIVSLQKIVSLQQQKPKYLLDYAEQFETGLIENQTALIQKSDKERTIDFNGILNKMLTGRDHEWGGYQAPKFPMPVLLSCFLYAGIFKKHRTAKVHTDTTLQKMALGGIHDPVDGGFSRYAVDHRWHVPHFEKMAYDNGQLLCVYSQAYKNTPLQVYIDSMYSIFSFIQQVLKNEEGGYFCALDADSKNENGTLQEGAYYTWSQQELKSLLGDDYALFAAYYNINEKGYWENDQYILFASQPPETFSKDNALQLDDFLNIRKSWKNRLLTKRVLRHKPLVDHKILMGWNALIASGFCEAYQATSDPIIANAAKELLNFLCTQRLENGSLERVWKKSGEGFLEDYALVIEALIKGYQTFFEQEYLFVAKSLLEIVLDRFTDPKHVFFTYQCQQQSDTLFNPIELEDNVIPSSNAVMTENQWWLGRYFDRQEWVTAAENRWQQILPKIVEFPRGYARWVRFGMYVNQKKMELVVTGPEARSHTPVILRSIAPHVLVAIADSAEQSQQLALCKNRYQSHTTQFYICYDYHCFLPTENVVNALDQLQNLA